MSYTLQCAPAKNNAAWKLWLTSFPSTGRFSMHKEEKRERERDTVCTMALFALHVADMASLAMNPLPSLGP